LSEPQPTHEPTKKMRQALHSLHIQTHGKGLVEITQDVSGWLREQKIVAGLLTIFCRHTSASLTLNENASPDVRSDFESYFNSAVPEDAPYWTHTLEGADDMPAHIKSALLGSTLALPVADGRLALGTWQGIYLCEHRNQGGPRSIMATAWGPD